MLLAMKIALVTCSDLPGWEKDDHPLHAELQGRGVAFEQPAWDGDVDWSSYDAALIRTTWDYMPRRDAFVAWAEATQQVTRLFNPAEVIRWNTHKGYLRDLAARGVPIAPTLWAEPGETLDVAKAISEQGWSRGFIKPVVGACAVGTLRFDADEAGLQRAQAHVDAMLAGGEGVMLQPYLAQVEVKGELSAIVFDGEISHAVQKIPVPGDYRVQDDHGASDHPVTLDEGQRELFLSVMTEAHALAPGLKGAPLLYARVDVMWDDDDALCVTELELVEPSLFFRHGPDGAKLLVDALVRRIG